VVHTLGQRALAHPRLLLIVLCLLLWLPGWFSLPPGDRDESRFAQASKQMLETGDLVNIRNGDEARNRKPIGIYWLQLPGVAVANAIGIAHTNPIWPYRLPSLAGGLLAVLAVERFGRRPFGAAPALLAAALLAASTLLTVEVHIAKTDAALLGATTLAMLLLAQAYLTGALSAWRAAVFWLAVGAGILIKGPVTPLVIGLTTVTLAIADRRGAWLRRLRPAWGIPLALVIILPWFAAIGFATHGAFFRDSLGGDLGGKLAGGDDAHGAPPGFHLVLLSLTLFPSGWVAPRALPAAWAGRREPATRFLLAWAIPAWLVFEAVPTKLPHYILPLLPPLCLMAARWLLDPARRPAPRWLRAVSLGLSAVAACVLGVGAAALPVALGVAWWLGVPALAAAMLLAWLVAAALRAGAPARAACLAAAACVPLYAALLGLELPNLSPLWLSPRVEAALAGHPYAAFATAGFAEPSLMFLCGTQTRFLGDGGLAGDFLVTAPGRVALVEARQMPGFVARVTAFHLTPRTIATIDGFNYSNGRRVRLSLEELSPPAISH
jgi:4-amino-4-deoxy-L-arabinose transferase-like glycosyltransferase